MTYNSVTVNTASLLYRSGFGDLWDDIQNVQEKDTDSVVPSVNSEEAEGSKESSHVEQDSDWRIEDDGDEDFSMSKEEEIIGTTVM